LNGDGIVDSGDDCSPGLTAEKNTSFSLGRLELGKSIARSRSMEAESECAKKNAGFRVIAHQNMLTVFGSDDRQQE